MIRVFKSSHERQFSKLYQPILLFPYDDSAKYASLKIVGVSIRNRKYLNQEPAANKRVDIFQYLACCKRGRSRNRCTAETSTSHRFILGCLKGCLEHIVEEVIVNYLTQGNVIIYMPIYAGFLGKKKHSFVSAPRLYTMCLQLSCTCNCTIVLLVLLYFTTYSSFCKYCSQ